MSHAHTTRDGSSTAARSAPDSDTGLIGRPTTPAGYLVSGVLVSLLWLVVAGAGAPFALLFSVGLVALLLILIGCAGIGCTLALRRWQRNAQRPAGPGPAGSLH